MNQMLLTACILFTISSTIAVCAEHPRLFKSAAEIKELRKRNTQEPFKTMIQVYQKQYADYMKRQPPKSPEEIMYDEAPWYSAALYTITGDKKYALDAIPRVKLMIEDKDFWNNPGSKGLSRAKGAMGVALAYDACYAEWPADFRKQVSEKLLYAANNMIASMGAGANNRWGNNWQGVRYGAAGIAALASDEPENQETAQKAYDGYKRHLRAALVGNNGWYSEGIGYMIYPWEFLGPFGIAAERAGLGDIRQENKQTNSVHLAVFFGVVAMPNAFGIRADLADDHTNYGSNGQASISLWYAGDKELPVYKWFFDHFVGAQGAKNYDGFGGRGVFPWMLYPANIKLQNPQDVFGLTYHDDGLGVAIWRNQFKDHEDIVTLLNAKHTKADGGHNGPDVNTFRIMGLGSVWTVGGGRTGNPSGQTNLFGAVTDKGDGSFGKMTNAQFFKDGSGSATVEGSSVGVNGHVRNMTVDYSKKSGVPAVIISNETSLDGKLWRLNTPEFNVIETKGNTFTLKAPNGATFHGTVIEPEKPVFSTGTITRAGVSIEYHGKRYQENKYIEFPADKNVCVVMTIQKTPPPTVKAAKTKTGTTIKINNSTYTIDPVTGLVKIDGVHK